MSPSMTTRTAVPAAATSTLPRLVPTPAATSLAAHLAHFGPLPLATGTALIDEVRQAGLRGRGGAGFPAAVKLAAVRSSNSRRSLLARRRNAVVVANGTEGEPASAKDGVLLARAPHLVIDGAVAAAEAVGADWVLVCAEQAKPATLDALDHAVAERSARSIDGVLVEVVATPSRYVAGEESALVNFLNGGDAKPTMVPPRPFERGVGGSPTLVNNVETLANIGLIARFGAAWWRSVGTADDPGSALFSLSGAVDRPGVYELPLGVKLDSVLQHAGAQPIAGVLIGGYFGTWLTPAAASALPTRYGRHGPRRCRPRLRRHRGTAHHRMPVERGRSRDHLAGRPDGGAVRPVRVRVAGDRRRPRRGRGRRPQRPGRSVPAAVVDHGERPRRVQAARRRQPLRELGLGGVRHPRRRAPSRRPVPAQPDAGDAGARLARGVAMTVRMVVNPITCVGHGICADLFPERITLDDWGYPIIDPSDIPPSLEAHAIRAADACPTVALILRRTGRSEARPARDGA